MTFHPVDRVGPRRRSPSRDREPMLTRRTIVAAFDRGLMPDAIATALGVTRSLVRGVCRRAGRSVHARRVAAKAAADREIADALDAGASSLDLAAERGISRSRVYRAAQRARGRTEVPAWVPDRLWSDFLVIALRDGEEAAAAWARRAKSGPLPAEAGR